MQEEKVQKLSEGYDFIEESTAFCDEPLNYQDINETVIVESAGGKTSPYKILGKISGTFAPIGEFSRNRRLYSENLWPTVLANEEFQDRLKGRRILSCLGHEDKKIDDFDLKEGKVSGVVSCLEVREDNNNKAFLYGEIDILDTPAGRILKAMHEGGAGLYVSSRGAGKLVPVPGQDYSMVTPENYYCHCFDTVLNPGFLKAKPVFEQVKEATHESLSESQPEVTTSSWIKTPTQPEVASESEVEVLRAQVEQLAKIVEKVVDDTYVIEEDAIEDIHAKAKQIEANKNIKANKESLKKFIDKKPEEACESLNDFFELMAHTNVSEDTMKNILEIIFNKEGK